jgi:hypothetical protein
MPSPQSATEERRERELEDVLNELGTDGRITVYHVVEGKASFAGTMTMDGFNLEALLETYGGGDKSLVFYQGKNKVDTIRVSLDPSIPPRNPKAAKLAPATAAAPGASGLGEFSALIAAMAQSQMSSMQMMQTMMSMGQQQMTSMLGAMTAFMTAKKDVDPTELLIKAAELFKSKPESSAAELFSVFEKGMSVASNLKGDDDGTLGVVKEGLGIIGKVVENNARNNPPRPVAAPAPRAALPARVPAPAPDQSPTTEVSEPVTTGQPEHERPWVAAARPAAPMLLMLIGNVTPATAASAIADRLSEDAFSDLLDDIETGTPGEFLVRFHEYFAIAIPEGEGDNIQRWLLQLVQEIKAMVEDDPGAGVAADS